MMKPKSYFPEIDICRGLGILLVVLGHALKQTGETNVFFQVLLSVIYSFHMPLFFVLSGFVSVKIFSFHSWDDRRRYIGNRAFRLLIPYFVVGILYMPVKILLSRFALKPYALSSVWRLFLGDNPDVALWYIYILFWISVLCALLVTERSLSFWLGVSFLCALVAFWTDSSLRLPQYWFFFLLGLLIRCHYEKIMERIRNVGWVTAALVVFAAANGLLYLKGWNILHMVTSISGIALSLAVSLWLSGRKAEEKGGLKLLGGYSMDIYILSEPLITAAKLLLWNMLHLNYIVCTLLCFLIGIGFSVPISKYIIRRVKLFRIAFLGTK